MDASLADYLRAILLGLVQALTEFLPVSSSGHLILVGELIGDEVSSLTFDVALHVGTLAAVLGYFWRDWWRMGVEAAADLGRYGVRVDRWRPHARLAPWIALATIPAAIAGLLFEEAIEETVRAPWIVAVMLILVGIVMWIADRWGDTILRILDMTPGRALIIGLAQVVALIPGTSRSGSTIIAGRALGFDRPSAARFSFLLSAPIVFAAGVQRLISVISDDEAVLWGPMIVGMLVAAVVGALVIRMLLAFLQHRTLAVFVWYRIAAGLVVLALVATDVL